MDHHTIWHESNEVFFKALGDEAQLQALCHMKSHEEYSKRSRGYQLPIIILSVMCGSGNFVSTSFPENQDTIILGVGVLSIITSIISSIAQYLKLAEKSEAYRIAYVSWEKFYNNIRFQLSKRREEREDLQNYMSSITNEYQRLQEISPLLPDKITRSILWNKKKVIKQGMNVPVSLRNVKPTGWWDEEKGDLTINQIEINTPSFDDDDSDDSDLSSFKKKSTKKSKKSKKEKKKSIKKEKYLENISDNLDKDLNNPTYTITETDNIKQNIKDNTIININNDSQSSVSKVSEI